MNCIRDTNQLDKIVDYAERGGLLYRQNGNPEAAAQLLEKAAKILEQKHPDRSLSLYTHAAETVGTEGRDKEASELLTKVAKLQVKMKMWDKAKGTTSNLDISNSRGQINTKFLAKNVLEKGNLNKFSGAHIFFKT